MDAGAKRTAAATSLLGRSATDMAAVLNMTAEETEALKQETRDYGMVMSDEAVKASATFQDNMTKMQYTVTGLKNKFVGELLPGLSLVIDGFTDLIAKGEDTEGKLSQGVESIVRNGSDALKHLTLIVSSFASTLIEVAPTIILNFIMLQRYTILFIYTNFYVFLE